MPAVMSIRVKIVALVISIGMMLLIIELVRRRKLREEYSWLWLLTGSVIIVLMMWFGLLKWTTHLIGAIKPSSAIFFLAFLFLFIISLHFSVVISKLTDQVKELAQRNALLETELQELKKQTVRSQAGSS
jgi:cell division protein FtsB